VKTLPLTFTFILHSRDHILL